jgi:anaerobic magnesium-protoporphyrin IX monomethyl ester cyclase
MRIQFIYPNFESEKGDFQLGVASLSAVLKEDGHKVNLIHLKKRDKKNYIEKVLIELKKFNPDLVGFSITEFGAKYVEKLSKIIKQESNAKIIVGGPYATLAPEEIINLSSIDYVARGEAEETLTNLVRLMENNKKIDEIKGIWVKDNDKIIRNELDSPPDIDSLPFPDRSIFDEETIVGHEFSGNSETGALKKIGIMCSRGCPFNCTYCINEHVRNLYPVKDRYVRFRKVDRVIEEIKELQKIYKFNSIGFYDDTMLLNKKWITEFAEKYKKEIGLPFYANARPETCQEDLISKIADAGCKRLQIGIESGSEEIRSKVLNRHNTNNQITEAFKLAKKYNLETYSFNMVGLPFETTADIKQTIVLNSQIKPDAIQVSVFYPFRGTKLGELCYENDWVVLDKKNKIDTYYEKSILNYPQLTTSQINYYYNCYFIYYSLYTKNISELLKYSLIGALKKMHLFEIVWSSYRKMIG